MAVAKKPLSSATATAPAPLHAERESNILQPPRDGRRRAGCAHEYGAAEGSMDPQRTIWLNREALGHCRQYAQAASLAHRGIGRTGARASLWTGVVG
jgi:hypothetical protein